ncbi:MAG: HlyD family secretion protein [Acetobacteraceae bacterium]
MDQPIPEWTFDPASDEVLSRAAGHARPRLRFGRALLVAGAALAVAGVGVGGGRWWEATKFLVGTDDAYLESDAVTVSPQVAGAIAELDVTDNEKVRAGQVLARIDDRPFRARAAKATADVAAARAKLTNIAAEIAEQASKVASARAVVAADGAALSFASADAARYGELRRSGFGTAQMAERTGAGLRERAADLRRDRAALKGSEQQIGVLESARAMAAADLKADEAVLAGAELNLSYTLIKAPVGGVVGDRGVRLGAYVAPGTPLLQVVPMGRAIYVTANFKETEIKRLAPGEPVRISIDGFPAHALHGTVASLAPGSGSQFALLPPENATGNFTKIVQRVPVKIRLAGNDPLLARLRPGLSVEATVDTETMPTPSLALAEAALR